MLELNFDVFWEHYQAQKKLRNEDYRILHYEEYPTYFKLFLKSIDYWEYFTTLDIKKIQEFGISQEMHNTQAMKTFKGTFLRNAVPIKIPNPTIDELPEELNSPYKSVTKKLQPLDDEDAKDYNDFLEKQFRKWEKEVMSFVETTLSDEVITKSFGEFMQRLFNSVNTAGFRTKLKASLKKVFNKGIEEAELEIKVDVGFDVDFENDLNSATNRQLDGFMIQGKSWGGIKGVSREVQSKIRESVVKSIEQKDSMGEIKDNVKSVFKQYTGDDTTEGKAMLIARTESTRISNSAKLTTYKKSGLVGRKKWNSFLDSRTSDVCKRLNGQVVGLDDFFVDPQTGDQFQHPPSLPNCRSVLSMVLE